MYISHETIYNLIFSFKLCEGHKCVNGINILKRKTKKSHQRRNKRRYKTYYPSIHKLGLDKKNIAHLWFIDTFYIKGGYIVIAVENMSKKVMMELIPNLKAETMNIALRNLFYKISYGKSFWFR